MIRNPMALFNTILFCVLAWAALIYTSVSLAHCAPPGARVIPVECILYDLNHDGQVNVQDVQIAINRGWSRERVERMIRFVTERAMNGACEARP